MDAVAVGVSIALEAHRRRLLDDAHLQAVLHYYDGEGAHSPAPPASVLARVGGIPESRALELIELTPLPTGHRRFSDRLTTHEVIGRGGMGTVYKGFDRLLKRVVALKVLDLSQVSSSRRRTLLGRFEREARVMARLRHPAIAQLYDAGVNDDGNPYLAMELVPGRSLDSLIDDASEGLDLHRVLRWGATLAEALDACHKAGVIHRDVKPGNVIVTPEDEVRLIDFGIAVDELAATRLTSENALVGTVLYMAPEQARGDPCDARSDVYALGGTLFHALAGRPPHDVPSVIMLVAAIQRSPATRLRTLRPGAPVEIDELLGRCLERSPEARPADAGALASELRRALESKAAPLPTQLQRATRARALFVCLPLLTLGVVGLLTRSSSEPEVQAPAAPSVQRTGAVSAHPTEAPTTTEAGKPALPAGVRPGANEGEFVNTKDGSVLVFVPAGEFRMGYPAEESETSALTIEVKWNDRPAHRVSLSGYFIGKYEVTWGQYRRFAAERPDHALRADAHVVASPDGREFRATDDHPVFGVTWEQARAYCEWAGLRLPTEAEWEYAARGGREEQLYPWGVRDLEPGDANLYGDRDGHASVTRVGAFPKDVSPVGCFDTCGNVSEWVWDFYGPYHEADAEDPRGPSASTQHWPGPEGWRELPPGQGPLRVIRGGAWQTWDGRTPQVDFYAAGAYFFQSTRRYAGRPQTTGITSLGLRVCRGL